MTLETLEVRSPATIDRVHVPMALPLLLAAAAVITASLLYLTRRFDFQSDEWTFLLAAPNWGLKSYFEPHNEHWVTGLVAWYQAVLLVFGARHYQVFMAGVLLMDVAVACLLFFLIRQRSGELLALAAAAIMLGLGSGWEDIIWGFQIGFAGSVAFGLVAVLLLRGEELPLWRLSLASGALLCSLMLGGMGLFWLVLVTVDLVFSRPRRAYLTVVVVPVLGYLAWYAGFGHTTIATQRSPFSWEALGQLATFVPTGIGATFSGVLGFAARGREIALIGVTAAVAIRWYQRGKVDSLVLGAVAGLVAEYAATGLVRAQYGDIAATESRYVWVAAVFALLILTDAARGLPWNRLTQFLFIVIMVVSLGLNGVHLLQKVRDQNNVFASQDAQLQVTWMVRQAPGLDRQGPLPIRTPPVSVGGYLDMRRALGSNLPDVQPSGLANLDATAVNQAFADALPVKTNLLATTSQIGGGACTASNASGIAEVQGRDGSLWLVTPSAAGPVTITVWYEGPASSAPNTTTVVGAGQSLVLVLPDSGLGLTWHLQIAVPPYLSASVCSSGP
ncbi:MAG TPA: hypothetical protein VF990_14785 [Candidatus Dormibacteraeota bacterium]